jgi:hypothetical protein
VRGDWSGSGPPELGYETFVHAKKLKGMGR